MFLRMVYDEKLAQAAYLIGCQRTGEAIVIDPERDVDRYIDLATRNGLRIVAVADTHIHADYLSGARELAEVTGAQVFVSGAGGPEWACGWLDAHSGGGSYRHRRLNDGDTFQVGQIEFKALHTPGHTPEHMCYLVTDRGGGAAEPMGLLSGDFLFVGDLGRPDLLESAVGRSGASEPAARQLFQTVAKLASLPDYLQVWPAHGAGSACGKALGAVPQSTLGYERRFNAALRAAVSETPFVQFILAGQPEPPVYFSRMKRDNQRGPRVLGKLPNPPRLNAAEARKLLADGKTAVVDTRDWKTFRAGHLRGALFHPLNGSFTTDVGSMVREDESICLVIEAGRVEEPVRDLVRIGLDNIVGVIEPATLGEAAKSGVELVTSAEIAVDEARKLLNAGRVAVLDVRRAAEHAAAHIDGARNIPHTRLLARMNEIPRDKPLLVHCFGGGRSARACALLQKNGFDVMNLAGGFTAWQQG